MKRFDSYEDLIKYIGVDSPESIIGLKNVLNSYLERQGSNLMKSKDEEPRTCFKVEIENTMYGIGVTSVEIKENEVSLQNTKDNTISNRDADVVVLSLGSVSNNSMINGLEKIVPIVRVLGDAEKPGRVAEAMHTAFEKSYFLE